MLISGRAYGRRATLDVSGDTLTWRARRGFEPVAENIATTAHDVRGVAWRERRWSRAGCVLAVLSAIWISAESVPVGIAGVVIALALLAHRFARPRRTLALDLGERWLVLRVDAPSAAAARTLTARIERRLLTGEVASTPPMLP